MDFAGQRLNVDQVIRMRMAMAEEKQRMDANPKATPRISQQELLEFYKILEFHKIEQYEVPSERPGDLAGNVVRGNIGASPKQLDLQKKFFSRKYRLLGAYGANRSGKTQALWCLCMAKHLRDFAQDGDLYWLVTTDFQSMIIGPMKWLWQWLPRDMFGRREYREVDGFGYSKSMSLILPDKRGKVTIQYKTEEQPIQSYERVPVHGIAWTEAGREAILDACLARTADYQGFMLLDYVPTEFWHLDRIKNADNKSWYSVGFAMADNAHNLPAGELEYQKDNMTEMEWQVRGLGKERSGFGVVYQEFDEDVHLIESFRIPEDWPRWRALDYGVSAPTACIWTTIAPAGYEIPGTPTDQERKIVYREYYQKGGDIETHSEAVKAMSEGEKFRGRMLIDYHAVHKNPASSRTIAQQYKDNGLACKGWPKSNGAQFHAQVSAVKVELQNRTLLVMDNCSSTKKEFRTWRFKTDKERNPNDNDIYEKKNDHIMDCVRGWIATKPVFSTLGKGTSFTEYEDE